MATFKKGTNTKTRQELIACIEEKAVFMATVDGKIYKQFPRQHLKEEQFMEEVPFPGDYDQARKEYCDSQNRKQEIDVEERRKQAEENRKRWYEERKQEVLTVRRIRNLAFESSEVICYKVWAMDMEFSSSDQQWYTVHSSYMDETSKYFFDRSDAEKYYEELKAVNPEGKTPIEVGLMQAEIESEDILRLSEYKEMECLWMGASYDYEESEVRWPEWKSIAGSVIVTWSWDTHVGYARKFHGLRIGGFGETEETLITGNEDYLFRPNCTIVCKAEDINGLREEEIRYLLEGDLLSDRWMWRNPRLVEQSVEELLECMV